ncbi:MAG: methylated-DNA-[protein]-cysteine S-methyltransferase [Solirubrobacterales bacterium]|jgi:methylated-DNA-[protein]-cysteine S-methyltransferase|nr:methylated-DNA-[protein]-cysteine S-methyltransferase [Solirubrobacterales bacterium]
MSIEASIDRVRERAAAEGLLDVAYTETDSPFGPLLLATTAKGLVRVGLPNQDSEALLEELAAKVSPRVLETAAPLDEVRRELDRYFAGQLEDFELPLDWSLTGGFRGKVQRQINRIPYGQTRTYTEIARRAGNERAVRAAGTACGRNPLPVVVPCHRVLRSGGGLGGYGGGLPMKKALLALESATALDERSRR